MDTTCPCCGQELPANIVTVDLKTNALIAGGVSVKLTAREAEVAYVLWSNRGRLFSKEEIADKVFEDERDGLATIPQHVMRVRRKIIENGLPVWIENVFGRGYRWAGLVDGLKNNEGTTHNGTH